MEALEIAQAADFVRQKEGNLSEYITQGATNLSGGQRQRLCIARAICRRPEMAEAIRSFRPQGLGRNKQMVADLVRGGRFGLLTGLYRLKNRM